MLMYQGQPRDDLSSASSLILRNRAQNKKANAIDFWKENIALKVYLSTYKFKQIILHKYFHEKEHGTNKEFSNIFSSEGHTSKGVWTAHTELDGLRKEKKEIEGTKCGGWGSGVDLEEAGRG